MEDNAYRCENCGGIMEFDAAVQALKCPNCDTVIQINNSGEDIVEHSFTMQAARTYSVREKTSSTMECTGCGATIEVAGDATAAVCPYCGSKYVLSDKQEEAIIPDGVIPFKIDANRVREIFGQWIKKRFFAPSNLKNLYQSGQIQGRYVPFWTFDAECHGTYTGMGGRDRQERYTDKEGNTHTRTVTDWYHTSGRLDHFFDDVLVRGTENFKASLVNGIDSYDTRGVVSYSPEYFSGFLSESYTVPLDTAHASAVSMMNSELHTMAHRDILRKYDHAKNVQLNVRYSRETYKHIIVPMYATSYAYNNKTYTVLVNGQNGEIKGEYPKSKGKIAVAAAIIAAIIIGLLVFYFTNAKAANDIAMNNPYTLCSEAGTEIDYEYDVAQIAANDYNKVEEFEDEYVEDAEDADFSLNIQEVSNGII